MDTIDTLKRRHNQVRLMLLASLVLFLAGLFVLVPRWGYAVPVIIFACVFRLAAVGIVRRRYNKMRMQASAAAAAAVLAPYCRGFGVALAACGGRLSLLLPGMFYARKPDIRTTPSEEMLRGGAIAGVEVLKKLCAKIKTQ